jgi:hypothetical protein
MSLNICVDRSRTDLLDALLEAKKQLRDMEADRVALKASNQRLEVEMQRQSARTEKMLETRFGSVKEAAQMRREIEKHVIIQQLKQQVSVLHDWIYYSCRHRIMSS